MVTNPGYQMSHQARRPRTGGGLYAHIVETLGQEIVGGIMPAQEIIHAEQLTERFGISRSVVRESLRTLSSMGLLEARPQVGTRVLSIDHWDLLNPQIIQWRGFGPDATSQQRELLELRLGVEPIAAHFAAARMSPESAQEILRSAEEMGKAVRSKDSRAFFGADARFHRLLLEGSHNLLISQFAETIDAGLQIRTTLPTTQLNLASVELHVALAQALLDRDSERSGRFATKILEQTLLEFGADNGTATVGQG